MGNKRERVLEAGCLRVRFTWHDDRWAHEVWLRDTAAWRLLLRSVEGTSTDDWPPSPPLQSIEAPRNAADRQIALLVGMAGKNHWAVSVELDSRAALARFDAACRIRGMSGPLGSRYEVLGPLEGVVAQSGNARVVAEPAKLVIEPQANAPASAAQTLEWSYTIRPLSLPVRSPVTGEG
jgi:hypothetical protein